MDIAVKLQWIYYFAKRVAKTVVDENSTPKISEDEGDGTEAAAQVQPASTRTTTHRLVDTPVSCGPAHRVIVSTLCEARAVLAADASHHARKMT